MFKSDKAEGYISFPTERIEYVAFTPPELVNKRDIDTGSLEEDYN